MVDYVKNNDIDLIIVKSIDRISRNTIDVINFLKEMKDLNIEVHCSNFGNVEVIDV